ncbi:peptidase associated/transthyretin-like domain-containing protein [Hymenobacter perfusus]|uniref:Carboxypeptidase-like regulatory domain-containing protein n=1 Tax=Hymenobacter perfusus TaxID=1236770 RepID=A0A3R9MY73_9BACT|nr:hypothetical protein [Hymenobacter perfusus]RSK43643.1 hypothetical protein EI293_12230 [Hymenobacter perfusus]
MFQVIYAALFWCFLQAPVYKALIVDAKTGQPVEFAAVEQLDDRGIIGGLTASSHGEFSLPSPTVHIRVSRLGYTPLEVTRLARSDNRPDTIRLFPQATALQEILVRPGRPVTLATFPDGGRLIGSGLLPGQAVAVLLRPDRRTTATALQLMTLRLYLAERPKEGRLRIRLLNVIGGGDEQNPPRPGVVDLLPTPMVYGLRELADLPGKTLTLNLASYSLTVPAEGVYVMVECLLTNPDLVLESVKLQPGKKPQLLIKAHTATKESVVAFTPLTVYPKLTANYAVPTNTIWYRTGATTSWVQRITHSYSVRMELDALQD